MANNKNLFHLVTISPWPICASGSALIFILSIIILIYNNSPISLSIATLISATISYLWWRDISRESNGEGSHWNETIAGLKFGILLFITSEVMFFAAFFWAYLHSSISPTWEIGLSWPPASIITFNPISIPLLNTVLLVSSGISLTWAHHLIMDSNLNISISIMLITIVLGLLFSFLQWTEYNEAPFSLWDSTFSSTFFLSTGFHGLHVLIGTTFLIITTIRLSSINLDSNHIVGFECSAWYWHFVDVVWLFLYTLIYWWGSSQ